MAASEFSSRLIEIAIVCIHKICMKNEDWRGNFSCYWIFPQRKRSEISFCRNYHFRSYLAEHIPAICYWYILDLPPPKKKLYELTKWISCCLVTATTEKWQVTRHLKYYVKYRRKLQTSINWLIYVFYFNSDIENILRRLTSTNETTASIIHAPGTKLWRYTYSLSKSGTKFR